MNCPVCQVPLSMAERQGVEIDYCPKCRGVWLDRGELDKIVEQSVARGFSREPEDREYDERGHDSRDYEPGDPYKRRRRRSFLGDLFDLD